MNTKELEAELSKSAVAPRVTPADIEASMSSIHYFSALDGVDGHFRGGVEAQAVSDAVPLKLLTFCVIVLKNGFTVTGQSACASPENFNADIGRRLAYEDACRAIWPLLGFNLRDRLHREGSGAKA